MRGRWLILGMVGCGPGPGDPCEATGEGFSRRDPCPTTCVETEVPCDDGSAGVPGVCAGDPCDADGACPEGWGCAAVDSFARACLPLDTCPDGYAAAP
jgi:hypothetical protein